MARRAWVAYARVRDIGPAALAATRRRLSGIERRRYARFASARRAREFLAGRWLVGASRRANPGLRNGIASISHSGGWVACALVERGTPGVDIEPMLKRDFAALGAWAFPADADEPWRREAPDFRRAFYVRWTRYEARVKSARVAYSARTWLVDGVALSACLPWLAVRQVGAPRRFQRRWGFVRRRSGLDEPATLKTGNFERR